MVENSIPQVQTDFPPRLCRRISCPAARVLSTLLPWTGTLIFSHPQHRRRGRKIVQNIVHEGSHTGSQYGEMGSTRPEEEDFLYVNEGGPVQHFFWAIHL
jgi:hypothetical protein